MIRILKRLILSILLVVVVLAISVTAYLYLAPIFGASGPGSSNPRIAGSPQFKNGRFHNGIETVLMTDGAVDPDRSTLDFFFPPPGKRPVEPMPSERFQAQNLSNGHAVWLGHSTFLFRTADRAVLVDPVFYSASPVPYSIKAFPMRNPTRIEDLPPVDAVLISHDHYDHLDYKATLELDKKVGQFLVPLGVGAHLARWGINPRKVVELDWYEHHDMGDMRFTLTPARHFSGRGLTNRNTTLWGGWAINSPSHNVFYSGDSGYFSEFLEIAKRLGPFDIAFLENGAYDATWAEIHMTPEESVRASVDLQAAAFFPVHWAKFDLAYHMWDEPIRRAKQAAEEQGVTLVTPRIGAVFSLDSLPQPEFWWESVR